MSETNTEKKEKVTLRQTFAQTLRGAKMWHQMSPRLFPSLLLARLFSVAQPYAVIYLSARVISELAGARDPQRLTFLVLLTLGVTALLSLLSGLCNRWYIYEDNLASSRYDKHFFVNRAYTLDYADVDDPKIHDEYTQIRQSEMSAGYGLRDIPTYLEQFLGAFLTLVGGIALSAALFFSPVTDPQMAILNQPLVNLGVIALMLLISFGAPQFSAFASMSEAKYVEEDRFANRVFATFCFGVFDRERATDMRIYRQQENICEPMLVANPVFTPESTIGPRARTQSAPLYTLSAVISVILSGVIYVFVCLKARGGAFGIGEVTQYISAITSLFGGLASLVTIVGRLRANVPFLNQVFAYLDRPSQMYRGTLTTEKRSDRQYDVEFRDVSFRYPGRDEYVLRHVNLRFRVGSRLAVVGQNGSGKSTFIKLLCRLYDPTEGEILLNGIDIRKYRYDDYCALFSVVFQDYKLFPFPLGQNVAGSSQVDEAKVRKVLDDVGFSDRLSTLPDGLNTYLFKNLDGKGVDLSGGEAQKVAIARALYKDAPFIILDEPTAALDPLTEAEIYSRFNGIAGDKTAIYISHRLSSCKFCDEIAVFDHGQIVQFGAHDVLVQQEGKYAELWQAQAQYYQ